MAGGFGVGVDVVGVARLTVEAGRRGGRGSGVAAGVTSTGAGSISASAFATVGAGRGGADRRTALLARDNCAVAEGAVMAIARKTPALNSDFVFLGVPAMVLTSVRIETNPSSVFRS